MVESKAPGSTLYPTDPAERALVNQRLYFSLGTFHARVRAIAVSITVNVLANCRFLDDWPTQNYWGNAVKLAKFKRFFLINVAVLKNMAQVYKMGHLF